MANLRIVRYNVKSSKIIEIVFTHILKTISSENIKIESVNNIFPDITIVSTSISDKTLTINVLPMIPRNQYKLTLFSTLSQSISGINNERLIEDGSTNIIFFAGNIESNFIRDNIINDIPDIYNKEGSLVFDSIDASSRELLKVYNIVREIGSSNYISIQVDNEELIRGSGPYDRFKNEGVFKILRVSSTDGEETISGNISFDEFPADPVTLQQILIEEENVSNLENDNNGFNGLVITLSKFPIVKVTSIVLIQNDIEYEYDINTYRYGILSSKYDSDNSYSYLSLEENQIKLTENAIGSGFPIPSSNDTLIVSYYYKKNGRIVGSNSVEISTPISVTRESTPSVSTSFFLKNAPIVNNNGNIPISNGIVWLDPAQNYDTSVKHPSFLIELKYDITNMPKSVGEFSVNYETGQVFVFGKNGTGSDGTTTIPPTASYLYKKVYQENLDYSFYSDLNEIASLPDGSLRGNSATVVFSYEDNFSENTDYLFNSHIEVINEKVENRLIEDIGIETLYGPINEVFRIYNETTGEIYTPIRIKDNKVYFSSTVPPRNIDVKRESINFSQSIQSQLVVTEEILITGQTFKVFKIKLNNENIVSASGGFIGANFNTSLDFSDKDIFLREFYYNIDKTISQNLNILETIGDYVVDYENGIIYIAVSLYSTSSIGEVSYNYGKIKTKNKHIIRASDVYRSSSVLLENSKIFTIGTITDDTVAVDNLIHIGETVDSQGDPLVVSGNTITVKNDIFRILHIFQITDLKTKYNPVDFKENAIVSSSSKNIITLNSGGVTIIDSDITVEKSGSLNYIKANRIQNMFDSGLTELVSAISVTKSGVNYYSQGNDGYVDSNTNRIYLPSSVDIEGEIVNATYKAKLRNGAATMVAYTIGNIFIDYTYTTDEILIDYEYGDNILDWSISDSLSPGDTYYVTYKYGAMRNSLRDNFGILTGIEELSNIEDGLEREVYRSAIKGSLQSFPKGPTIPSIKGLVESFTQITPNITESAFLEWILGRDFLYTRELELNSNNIEDIPVYGNGKFGKGLLLNKDGQTASIPFSSNFPLLEGTWETFIIPEWDGISNDATLNFNILFDGVENLSKIFIGSGATNPEEMPFILNKEDPTVFGKPYNLHIDNGYFIWYDISSKKWRLRVRAPIIEQRVFSGEISTTGEFYNVKYATTADGYDGYEDSINELNDILRSTNDNIYFSFTVDTNDSMNIAFDAYDSYNTSFAGFDGIDFISDNIHYFFDAGYEINKNRISLYKDGKGFLKFRIFDDNKRQKILSTDISDWEHTETHHVAISWKIGTFENRDEMHLFVDGEEVPNIYRFGGFLSIPTNETFMGDAFETLLNLATKTTTGDFDLQTTSGSNIVKSDSSTFISDNIQIGDKFIILDNTNDGINTRIYPYVYVKNIVDENTLTLKYGTGSDFNTLATLDNVKFSVNPQYLETVSNPLIEKIKVFSIDPSGNETELYSPVTENPDYEFNRDAYQDYVNIYNNISIGDSVVLRTYGLNMSRCKQDVFIWSNLETNIINTKMPQPTSIAKINITKVITPSSHIDPAYFALIATPVGGHFIMTFTSNLDFCQPSNPTTGRSLTAVLSGNNINFSGVNKIVIVGNTTDSSNFEILEFNSVGNQSGSKYFTSITDIIATFTPIDPTKNIGSIEIRETLPINRQENGGDYAEIALSFQQLSGVDGYVTVGTSKITDGYARFDVNDIGKTFNILYPPAISGTYTISDVNYDISGEVKDSNTVTLSGVTWADSYSNIEWRLLNTFYGDSGFSNGLITLYIANSGGQPFLLSSCWYEIDFPSYLYIPWTNIPDKLYIGSDNNGHNQIGGVLDEVRILNETSLDTSIGESLPSSGRSITTDYQTTREFTVNTQTLSLFHFNEDTINSARFYSSYDKSFKQSAESVNSSFGQSGVFNRKKSYKINNTSIFNNNQGSIEFWVSPIIDTYNDPTRRYYIDLSPEQQTYATVLSRSTVLLPIRARSISYIEVSGSNINYATGSSLSSSGYELSLAQPLPFGAETVLVTFTPITSQGDRFSIYKSEDNKIVLAVRASEVDYIISSPVFWKKNSWHRIFVGWDLNNEDNQDRLIFMVDGTEGGIIKYGTGLIYGTGVVYGQPLVWGSSTIGTISSRNILSDINLLDTFNFINIGADFTEQYTALAKMDNIRFSSELRNIIYLGGQGPGQLIGKDLLFTSNTNTAQPVISDALTRLLIDFDTEQTEVEYLAKVRQEGSGIFDFYVEVIDTFSLADTTQIHNLITALINRIKPAHTRAFVSFTK